MVTLTHRKLLQSQDPNQNSTCSDCGPTCRYICNYPEFYWPPEPPPTPPHITTTHISPYVIIIAALLASAFLFFSYYLIMVRCSTRFRRAPSTPISTQDQNFPNQDHTLELELDHPIWYINTIGLQPSVIKSITIFKYKKLDNLIDCTDCSICLNNFQDNETLRLLPKCNHAFHIPCIDTWLSSHTNCPLCRAGILSAVSSSNDHNIFSTMDGLNDENIPTQMGNLENNDVVPEIENCDDNEELKMEYDQSVMGARRSVSIDSVGEIGGVSGDSTVDIVV